jgi:NAD(P)-dependent dehydrogenase (short-subunit alcohol dehydrogenase family)
MVLLKVNIRSDFGFEINLVVNYLAVNFLTKNLQNLLFKSTPARVVNVSSIAHKRRRINMEELTNHSGQFFDSYKTYADSK